MFQWNVVGFDGDLVGFNYYFMELNGIEWDLMVSSWWFIS